MKVTGQTEKEKQYLEEIAKKNRKRFLEKQEETE